MIKSLSFALGGKTYSAAPVKLDRKKLYGWQEKIAYDDDGGECVLASTDESGSIVLPPGGIGLGILTPEGEWAARGSLKAVKTDGTPAELIPSSFNGAITLDKMVSDDEFLNHTINAVYELQCGEEFRNAIGNTIFTFQYIYRDGYETTAAFVLSNGDTVFMLLGFDAGFEMLPLKQTAEIDETDCDDDGEDDDEELDFAMI